MRVSQRERVSKGQRVALMKGKKQVSALLPPSLGPVGYSLEDEPCVCLVATPKRVLVSILSHTP